MKEGYWNELPIKELKIIALRAAAGTIRSQMRDHVIKYAEICSEAEKRGEYFTTELFRKRQTLDASFCEILRYLDGHRINHLDVGYECCYKKEQIRRIQSCLLRGIEGPTLYLHNKGADVRAGTNILWRSIYEV